MNQQPDSLEIEYFWQDEVNSSTPFHRFALVAQAKERGFTLHAHRLSSLWRGSSQSRLTLMAGKEGARAPSSCRKYSTGVWGCETPTPPMVTGRNV